MPGKVAFAQPLLPGWKRERNTERANQAALQQSGSWCSMLGGAGQEWGRVGCKGAPII